MLTDGIVSDDTKVVDEYNPKLQQFQEWKDSILLSCPFCTYVFPRLLNMPALDDAISTWNTRKGENQEYPIKQIYKQATVNIQNKINNLFSIRRKSNND